MDETLDCGCASECCGICVHAKAAGRTRENVADFKYPNLNKLRGKKKRAQRDGDGGEPMMWFWQVEGRRWGRDGEDGERWGLDGESFDVAKKAWERLAATEAAARRGE